jgi:flavin reductase (DIM6/NTAB) family NADH-FMN oxidoreductase RutF
MITGARLNEPQRSELRDAVRRVHRQFPTGVTIVTMQHGDVPYGLAVNAFSSICLDPPMVLVCVAGTSATYPHLFHCDELAVNILAHDQGNVVERFARSGGDKFAGLDWHAGENGAPVLAGVSAHLELRIERRLPAYTHTIFTGRVTRAVSSAAAPLIYLDGQTFAATALTREP